MEFDGRDFSFVDCKNLIRLCDGKIALNDDKLSDVLMDDLKEFSGKVEHFPYAAMLDDKRHGG
jgi:hypothetical protein